ncbi:MAG: hypothetical protein N2606_00225 [Candidatus Omnitrophica bacterium]|nr:hypothetical protein [Candidatus Omnitrophota bacterium]
MLKRCLIFTIVYGTIGAFLIPYNGLVKMSFAQEVTSETFEEGSEITVRGELFKLSMTELANNPWKELAIKDENGRIFILLGEKVKEILNDEGSLVEISGRIMPGMFVKGKPISVIHIETIKKLDTKQ